MTVEQPFNQLTSPNTLAGSYRFDDWQRLTGAIVEVRSKEKPARLGIVDAAAANGSMVWVCEFWPTERFIVDKAQGDEIWISPTSYANPTSGG